MQGKQRNSEDKKELLVVSNSSVIIALTRIYCLNLLKKLLRRILVPEAVWQKMTVRCKPGSEEIIRTDFIHVREVHNKKLALLLKEFVDESEAEVITLALEVNADLLLVDDYDARSLAKELRLKVMGILGVIALAKYRGLILKAKSIVDELVKSGFQISRRVLEEFLRELDEK